MTKELIIIALIIVIIYLAYQQNQTNNNDNSQEIQNLQTELKHYQTLYEKRIKQDLEHEDSEVIYDSEKEILTNQLADLTATKQGLLKTISQNEENLLLIESKHNEQLRQINQLFSDQAEHEENVDFADLYSLLKNIAQKSELGINTPSPLSHKERRILKKRK
ncbi:MAG: Phosphonoacetaldehyde hydrolase [Mycoplasmataceae bacterium]|nr:MAG: Phosphonoacetaldehyde hydrolase [Mycoplasmataceae bacterium]